MEGGGSEQKGRGGAVGVFRVGNDLQHCKEGGLHPHHCPGLNNTKLFTNSINESDASFTATLRSENRPHRRRDSERYNSDGGGQEFLAIILII